MPIVIGPDGQRFHFSVPYSGERFQVTRYGFIEDGGRVSGVDHVIVKDAVSGCSVKADEEDAVSIDRLCAALNAGEISDSVLEEKLNWYFEATSH